MQDMKLEIVLWPDPVLLDGSQPVTEVDDEVREIVAAMREVMFDLGGVGLAAPQVGIPRRIMLVCPSGRPGEEEVVLNPEIVEADGRVVGEEGCLSFPDIYGKVARAKVIKVRYQDLDLRPREMELTGFVARVYQHEHDHLEGKVFIDRMEPSSRKRIEAALEDLRERYAAGASQGS